MSELLQDGAHRHTEYLQERNQYDDIIAKKKGGDWGRPKSTAQEKKTKKLPERTHPKPIYTYFLIETQNFGFMSLILAILKHSVSLINRKPVFKESYF